jgi:hypothetical protein
VHNWPIWPGRRQLRRAQLLAGAFDELLHPELLRPLVRFVEILRVPAEPRGRAQFAPTADLVVVPRKNSGSTKVSTSATGCPQRACQSSDKRASPRVSSRCEIRVVRAEQNEEARMIDDQRRAAALFGRPADELIALAQMIRRRTETYHCEPLAPVSGA